MFIVIVKVIAARTTWAAGKKTSAEFKEGMTEWKVKSGLNA